jgi:hypothetical protein
VTDLPARDRSPGLLRRIPAAGSTPIAVSACSAAAWMVLSVGVVHTAAVASGILASTAVGFACAVLRVVGLWSRTRSEHRRRRAVDRLIEDLTAELRTSGGRKQRREENVAELQAVVALRIN